MILKTLKLQNIRSYKKCEISFPKGSILLTGEIGSGKTTILLAIEFALFGLHRGLLSGNELLRHGENTGSVELSFEVDGTEFVIYRSLRRSKSVTQGYCYLITNGIRYELTPTELTAKILSILNSNFEITKSMLIFNYTVYTPQDQMKQILLNPQPEIFRKIFSIEKYSNILNNTKILLNEMRARIREYEAVARNITEQKLEYEKKLEELEKASKIKKEVEIKLKEMNDKIIKHREKMHEIEKKIFKLREKKEKLISIIENIKSNENLLFQTEEHMNYLMNEKERIKKILATLPKEEVSIKTLENELKLFEEENKYLISQHTYLIQTIKRWELILKQGRCSVCGQKVENTKAYIEQINNKKKKLKSIEKKQKNIETKKIEKEKELEEARKKIMEFEQRKKYETELQRIESRIQELSENIKLRKKERERLKEEKKNIERLIANLEEETKGFETQKEKYEELLKQKNTLSIDNSKLEQVIVNIKEHLARLEKELKEMENAKRKANELNKLQAWIEEEFIPLVQNIEGNVISNIQRELNMYFEEWLSILLEDEHLNVTINEHFEPVITQNGYETDYHNLSGGEKTAIALAYRLGITKLLNTISDIKTKDIIILDEPTDGFSETQLDRIRDVLEKLNISQILIVSHEPKIETFVDNVLHVIKEHHVSRIEMG